MEQLADISHIVAFAGVLQASVEDGTVCPRSFPDLDSSAYNRI